MSGICIGQGHGDRDETLQHILSSENLLKPSKSTQDCQYSIYGGMNQIGENQEATFVPYPWMAGAVLVAIYGVKRDDGEIPTTQGKSGYRPSLEPVVERPIKQSFQKQLDGTKWCISGDYFNESSIENQSRKVLRELLSNVVAEFEAHKDEHFSDKCIEVGVRIQGLGIFSNEFRPGDQSMVNSWSHSTEMKNKICVSDRFVNTNASRVLVGCVYATEQVEQNPLGGVLDYGECFAFFALEPEGGTGETMDKAIDHDGSHLLSIHPQPGESFGEMLYGKALAVPPNKAFRLYLSPKVKGAIITLWYEMREKDKQEELYETNKRVARDEACWKPVRGFFEDLGRDLSITDGSGRKIPTNIDPEFVSRCLTSYGVSEMAQKYATMRIFERPNKWLSAYCPSSDPCEVYCIWAKMQNGNEAEEGDHVATIYIPLYNLGIEVELGNNRQTMNMTPGDDDLLKNYSIKPEVLRAVMVRVPELRADQERARVHSLMKTCFDGLKLNENDSGERGHDIGGDVFFASRKRRTCAGCGIVWLKKMHKCSRCGKKDYCSRVCQVGHWKEKHKLKCKPKSEQTK
mmetsp:Transcript_29579/g.62741  ORF Transcript_29579/g.62741 Transcript_29579/m.62741 type:complete len:573 (+) Transcript_29579:501-2219(+)